MVKAAATASRAKTPTNRLSQIGKTSYLWADRDPVLDELCSIIQQSGKSVEWIEREAAKIGRPISRYTLLKWLYGTKRPQNYGMDSVCMVLGVKRRWTHEDGSELVVTKTDPAKIKFLRDPKVITPIEPAYPDAPALPAPTNPDVRLVATAKVPAKSPRSRKREAAE